MVERHSSDPANVIGNGLASAVDGIGDLFNSATTAMDNNQGARNMGQWAAFGLGFIALNHVGGQLIDRLLGARFFDRIPFAGGFLKNVVTIGLAIAGASGLASWFANSRDPSELMSYLGEGITDTLGIVGRVTGIDMSGITGAFNGSADPATVVQPVVTQPVVTTTGALALTSTAITPDLLEDFVENDALSTAALALNNGDPSPLIDTASLDARITAAQQALRTAIEGASLPYTEGNFRITSNEDGGTTTYTYVPLGADGATPGAPVTITQEQFNALQTGMNALGDLTELRDNVGLHNDSARALVSSFYDFNAALEGYGLQYDSGSFDFGKIVERDGDYFYDMGNGQAIDLDMDEAGYNALRTKFQAFTDNMTSYGTSLTSLRGLTDLPDQITVAVADGPTRTDPTMYGAPDATVQASLVPLPAP